MTAPGILTPADLCHSDTAVRLCIDNTPPPAALANLHGTADLLGRIGQLLSVIAGHSTPLTVTSGYRCLTLNRQIGSQDNSDHVLGCAADFKCPAYGTPYQVAKTLAPYVDELGIGQLIHEYGAWVHVSTRLVAKPVNRIITYKHGSPVLVGVQEV